MNNITDLLDLEDSDIKISDIIIEGQTKTLIIETPPVASYRPICGFRMHSRGVKKRTINPVSYTHLDVYKRQVHKTQIKDRSVFIRRMFSDFQALELDHFAEMDTVH